MKKFGFILTVLIGSFLHVHAQFGNLGYEEIVKLKKTKTYVVLTDTNSKFNTYIKTAVDQNWKYTKVSYIPFSKLQDYCNDPANSFIVVSSFSASSNTLDFQTHYSFYTHQKAILARLETESYGTVALTIQLGGKNFNELSHWMVYCYGGILSQGLLSPKVILDFKLLCSAMKVMEDKKLKSLKWNDADKYYNSGKPLTGKTVILSTTDIPIKDFKGKPDKKFLNKTAVAEFLTCNFEIQNNTGLEKTIASNDDKYLFLGTYVEGSFNVLYLYDCKGNVQYFTKMGRITGEHTYSFKDVLKEINKALK